MSDGFWVFITIAFAVLVLVAFMATALFYPTWCQYLPEPGHCVTHGRW